MKHNLYFTASKINLQTILNDIDLNMLRLPVNRNTKKIDVAEFDINDLGIKHAHQIFFKFCKYNLCHTMKLQKQSKRFYRSSGLYLRTSHSFVNINSLS